MQNIFCIYIIYIHITMSKSNNSIKSIIPKNPCNMNKKTLRKITKKIYKNILL